MNSFVLVPLVALVIASTTVADTNHSTSAFTKEKVQDVPATKRGAVQAKLAEAAVNKGVDVTARLAKKQIETWEGQTNKASQFLKKKINIDIKTEPGWKTDDLFVPPGYQINEEEHSTDENPESGSVEDPPYNYAHGFIGPAIMNGCYGSGYEPGDPCYAPMEATQQCRDMMEGCGFIGVGFDGREEYSPASRRMSIIQRNCAGKGSYGGEQVPDTMNVHGLYDTSATMTTFSSRSEYQKYLQEESGVSGSAFGFYAGVKKAWGKSSNSAVQTFLSMFTIDVTRYEIFKDEVKPSDLSQSFLKEFMSLPESYFAPRAPLYYQDFIQRWGTHYIKSAKFGGQLQFRKLLQGEKHQTKEEVSEQMEVQYKSLFWSAGKKSSSKQGSSQQSEKKTTKTSLEVQGGSQEIASILSDTYSPTFKNEFKEWLNSIPKYPKAFKFTMSQITELLDFRAGDLFPDKFTGGCDTHMGALKSDGKDRYYMKKDEKVFCHYKHRKDVDESIKRRRRSLKRAIEVYMEEGPRSVSDITLRAGSPGCQTGGLKPPDIEDKITYAKLKEEDHIAVVKFDMRKNIVGKDFTITYDMERFIKYSNKKWITSEGKEDFFLYNASPDLGNNILNFNGLPLTYDEKTSTLLLGKDHFEEAKKMFGSLKSSEYLKDRLVAVVRKPGALDDLPKPSPCNVEWDNMNLFQRTPEGKCLHFAAASAGPIYVVFAVIPSKEDSWYFIDISSNRVTIFKAGRNIASTGDKTETNALGIVDPKLFQTYFVCIKEDHRADRGTIIEYGKTHGTSSTGTVYLSVADPPDLNPEEMKAGEKPLKVEYYAFGNGESALQIANFHVVEGRANLQAQCKGQTKTSPNVPYCLSKVCHQFCDPFMGCTEENDATKCGACRFAKSGEECFAKCPNQNMWPNGEDLECSYTTATFSPVTNRKWLILEKAGLVKNDLSGVTVCARVQSTRHPSKPDRHLGTVFSYSNAEFENAIILGEDTKGVYFFIQGTRVSSETRVNDGEWHQICGTWLKDGRCKIYVDRKNVAASYSFKKDELVKGGGIVWIGQDLDIKYTGQEFDYQDLWQENQGATDALVAKVTAINFWAQGMSRRGIWHHARSCGNLGDKKRLFSWFDVKDFKQINKGIEFEKVETCPAFKG